jgi:hypothetical protein
MINKNKEHAVLCEVTEENYNQEHTKMKVGDINPSYSRIYIAETEE